MITDPLCETHSVNYRSYCYGRKTEAKSDKIHALVENYKEFLKRKDDVPNIYKTAVVVNNAIASNADVKELLSTRVSEMYSNIASAIIASDDTVAESELMFTFQLADRLFVYAENNLSQEAKKKMMVLES